MNKNLKIALLFSSFIIYFSNLNAQTLEWAKALSGATTEEALGIAVDTSGNVITTGRFDGTADFNPGAGIFSMTTAGVFDIFISKLDPNGNFLWAKQIGSTAGDYGYSVTTDAAGNIYTTGIYTGTVDFDPGAGTFPLTAAGGPDIFILKLDPNGNFLFAKSIGGSSNDFNPAIALDNSGNIYTAGAFSGTGDFDPGAGTFPLTASGTDIFISKLDSLGDFVWTKQIGGANSDNAYSIKIDNAGNVLTTGYFDGTVDFDPGAAIFNLSSITGSPNQFISKLDNNGNFIWAKSIGATDGTRTEGHSVTADASGNVYTTGFFLGAADFDPGAGSYSLVTPLNQDVFISKLNSAGNFVWAKQLKGGSTTSVGYSIAADLSGNIYTSGYFTGTVDFDPGALVSNISSFGSLDIFISTLDSSGNFSSAIHLGGTGADKGYAACLDNYSIYSSGAFSLTGDFDPGAGTSSLTAAAGSDAYVLKLTLCSTAPNQPVAITGTSVICAGSLNTYSIAPVSGATSYTWTLPGGFTGTSTTNSITATDGATGGNITVTANNTCGNSSAQTLAITVNSLPVIIVNAMPSLSICMGGSEVLNGGGGAVSYVWSGGITNNIAFTPIGTTTYTVTGTGANGCSAIAIATVTVNPLPTVTYSQSPSFVCENATPVSLTGETPSGGIFSGTSVTGSTFNVSTAGAGTYTITYTYTDVNSCSNTATSTIVVDPCTGIQQLTSNKQQLMIYPNPTTSVATLSGLEGSATIEVFNFLGEKIPFFPLGEGKEGLEIDLSKQANGIYFIKIKTEKNLLTKKIVKQ